MLSDAVTASEEEQFTRIVDGILAVADLTTVTRKKIREGLESALGRDLSSQKVRSSYVSCTFCTGTLPFRLASDVASSTS
jgi:hypothetical protein